MEPAEESRSRKVVGHDIFRVPWNCSSAARCEERATRDVVPHDIPTRGTRNFWGKGNERVISFCTTFNSTPNGYSRTNGRSEQSRSTRHSKSLCTTFFGRRHRGTRAFLCWTTFSPSNFLLNDFRRTKSINMRLQPGFWSSKHRRRNGRTVSNFV